MQMEIGFNLLYLILIWGTVVVMRVRFDRVKPEHRQLANVFWVAFFALAFGDTFHVGARTAAYFMEGGLQASIRLFGASVPIVGWSSLITAVTITIFYVFFLVAWIVRTPKGISPLVYSLFTIAGIRLGLLVLPENQWHQPVPVQPWAIIRNLPLIILGLGVAALFLVTEFEESRRPFRWLGVLILISYATYIPVVFYVQRFPLLGLLMIPKTMTYLVMAALVYLYLYHEPSARDQEAI